MNRGKVRIRADGAISCRPMRRSGERLDHDTPDRRSWVAVMAPGLFVEDRRQVAGLVRSVLGIDGHGSVVARDGEDAPERIAARSFDM
jgi:hypothetical protein